MPFSILYTDFIAFLNEQLKLYKVCELNALYMPFSILYTDFIAFFFQILSL